MVSGPSKSLRRRWEGGRRKEEIGTRYPCGVMTRTTPLRLRTLLIGEDPLLRYVVRASLDLQGVQTVREVERPQEVPRSAGPGEGDEIAVVCLGGPPEVWKETIAETRRQLPGGHVVAVTFGHPGKVQGAKGLDARLGADSLVEAPVPGNQLREAILRSRRVRPHPL